MADVEVSIGTGNSKIDGSDIRVGDISNQHHSFDHLSERVSELARKVEDIEKLLGGNLGIPGLTTQVLGIKDMVLDIKQEISELKVRESNRVSYGNFVVLILSVGAMCIAVLSTAWGLWR